MEKLDIQKGLRNQNAPFKPRDRLFCVHCQTVSQAHLQKRGPHPAKAWDAVQHCSIHSHSLRVQARGAYSSLLLCGIFPYSPNLLFVAWS